MPNRRSAYTILHQEILLWACGRLSGRNVPRCDAARRRSVPGHPRIVAELTARVRTRSVGAPRRGAAEGDAPRQLRAVLDAIKDPPERGSHTRDNAIQTVLAMTKKLSPATNFVAPVATCPGVVHGSPEQAERRHAAPRRGACDAGDAYRERDARRPVAPMPGRGETGPTLPVPRPRGGSPPRRVPGEECTSAKGWYAIMSGYTIALFVHVLGALGLFFLLGLEQLQLAGLRRARTVAQVRTLVDLGRTVEWGYPPAILAIIGAGLYLTATAWGWRVAWIDLALALTIAIAILAAVTGARHNATLVHALEATPDGPVGGALAARIADPAYALLSRTLVALAIGIVYLMTIKPDLGGALAALGVALALGLAAGAAADRRPRS